MSTEAERLLQAYPHKEHVHAATKSDVYQVLDRVRERVEEMGDFTAFPEGAPGVVIYALLENASIACPDVGDLGYLRKGFEAILKASFDDIAGTTEWFPNKDG